VVLSAGGAVGGKSTCYREDGREANGFAKEVKEVVVVFEGLFRRAE